MNYKDLRKGDVISYFDEEKKVLEHCLVMYKKSSHFDSIGLTKEGEIEEFTLSQRVLYHSKCKKITSSKIYEDLKKAEFVMRL